MTQSMKKQFSLKPIPLAITLALTSLSTTFVSGTAVAADVLAQASENQAPNNVYNFDIAAGTLSATLNAIAKQSGINIAYAPALTQDKSSRKIQGKITLEQALIFALNSTALVANKTTQGGYVVIEKTGGVINTLALTTVSGVSGDTTEGTGSYTTGSTNTATKLNLSLRETPQTVAVVTRQQMDDFAMTSVDDVLRATSGVFVDYHGMPGTEYYSRGFDLQSQYDGIPNPVGISQGNMNPHIDNAFLDRVEVLQGPSGLLSGAGDPGGTINLVRKRPTDEFQAHVEAQGGS